MVISRCQVRRLGNSPHRALAVENQIHVTSNTNLVTALGFKPSVAMLQVRKRPTLRRWGRVSYRLAYRICSKKMLIFADWSSVGRRCLSTFGRRFGCSWNRRGQSRCASLEPWGLAAQATARGSRLESGGRGRANRHRPRRDLPVGERPTPEPDHRHAEPLRRRAGQASLVSSRGCHQAASGGAMIGRGSVSYVLSAAADCLRVSSAGGKVGFRAFAQSSQSVSESTLTRTKNAAQTA